MVCDEANLICSHCKFSNIGTQDNPYTIERKYEKFIRFNVPDYMAGTFLMGGNAAGKLFVYMLIILIQILNWNVKKVENVL